MSTPGVEAALSLPPGEIGEAVVNLREDQWFERKSIRAKPVQLAAPLIAFANAEGGTIVVGVSDGRIEGIRQHQEAVNAIRQVPLDYTRPPVRARFEEIQVVNSSGQNDAILVIRVSPGDVVHESQSGDAYLRVGDESRKLGFVQRQELHFDRGGPPYDGGPVPSASVEALRGPGLKAFRKALGATGSDTAMLQARSLLTTNGEVTVAGHLLFHSRPQEVFPHAHVRVLRFSSDDRGTGARLNLMDADDHRVEGPIPELIRRATRTISDLVPKRRMLRASGHFEAVPIVPRDAWLEGLVNAVIHRSYSYVGDHVRVQIFPNRIEIESPGRFPGLVDPTRPNGMGRYARNPRIARACADLRIGQELGEGIPRIYEEMRVHGLVEPRWQQTATSVRLVLEGLLGLDEDVTSKLPSGAIEILGLLRDAGQPLGTGQLVDLSGLSRPTVRRQLEALRDQGLVGWVGSSLKDPQAKWQILPLDK